MTLGMNSPMVVPSIHAREAVDQQQKTFTHSWDPLFTGYSAALYFRIHAKKIVDYSSQEDASSMPPMYEVREVTKVPEKAGLESKMPIYDSRRKIIEEGHLALQDEMKCSTRKHLAPMNWMRWNCNASDESWTHRGPYKYPSLNTRQCIR